MFNKKLYARIAELEKEVDRLVGIIAEPELLGVQVDQNAIDISMRPREEIMRHLFLMCAHGMGESKNFVECTFGPDDEGRRYVVTLRHYLGKTPSEIADEKLAEAHARIAELEDQIDATA